VLGLAQPRTLVRQRNDADDSFIAQLSASAFAEYSRHPGQSTLYMARAGMTWVAERSDEPVGFVIARRSGEASAELCAIAVDESARGLGVGKALLMRLERALVRAGTRELTLHTADANASALELFTKHGFLTQRRLPRFYRGVFDAWGMHKRIA
jgi:ribosomal protein S18 acetylase RimI-like enzyme